MINSKTYQRISILGGGESGVGTALLCKKLGITCFLSDAGKIKDNFKQELIKHEVDFEENQHSTTKILNADAVIKSPGIPPTASIVQAIINQNIPIYSEIEFAAQFSVAKLIAVTGSNGKTTTTALVYHILNNADFDVAMAGNIGDSFARKLSESDREYFVLEVSSFQLEDISTFKPHIALLLNITPDHLDRYDFSFENYAKTKFKITQNQNREDYFIFNSDDKMIKKLMNELPIASKENPVSLNEVQELGAHLDDEVLSFNYPKPWTIGQNELSLKGKHNTFNSLAAGLAANLLNVKEEKIRASLQTFEGMPHRLEKVLSIRGVDYINDSKATNVNSTYFALESMTSPVIWIAGGTDKGNDYSDLYELAGDRVKGLICLGLDNEKLIREFSSRVPTVVEVDNMREAVRSAFHIADKGDCVLLSPACASFDLFKNYEHRGNEFRKEVHAL